MLENLKQQLKELELSKPQKLILPALYNEETNADALAYDLATGWKSSSLWMDEAGIIVGGYGMNKDNITKFVTLLNRLWDGNNYHVNRKTSESFIVAGCRFTCCLMMQPIIFEQLMHRCDNVSRGSGFLPRCLITEPESTMGTRPYKNPPPNAPCLNSFYVRISQILNESLPLDDKQRLNPKTLYLSPEAKNAWIDFHDGVEKELCATGEFHNIKDFASKAAENAARLAGIFHIFCNESYDLISIETMQNAIGVITWHLSEVNRLFAITEMPQNYKDAQTLLTWLIENQHVKIKLNHLLQLAPNCLRTKDRRDNAIAVLIEHKYIKITEKNNTQFLLTNPKIWEQKNAGI